METEPSCIARQLRTKRLHNQLSKLKRDTHLLQEYDHLITKQKEARIIEEVPFHASSTIPGKTHYIPNHPVV